MATPHIAANKGQIAKVVAMAGDPKRVKLFVDNYMSEAKLVSDVRGILAYTGIVNGKEVTVMAHGMGFGSMGIYAWELFDYYGVETILRFGSCGGYGSNVDVLDLHVATEAWTDNNFGLAFGEKENIVANEELTNKVTEFAKKRITGNRKVFTGPVHSTPWFYRAENQINPEAMDAKGIMTVEMEAYALYATANHFKRKALTILTVSDHLVKHEQNLSAQDRETAFTDMFDVVADTLGYFG